MLGRTIRRFQFTGPMMLIFGLYGMYVQFDRAMATKELSVSVTNISSMDDSCRSRRSSYACTRYTAQIEYDLNGQRWKGTIGAGSARGHGQPTSYSDLKVGAPAIVMYNPKKPGPIYRQERGPSWFHMMVLMSLVGLIISFLAYRKFLPSRKPVERTYAIK